MISGFDDLSPLHADDTINFKLVFEYMPGYSALLATDAPNYTILAVTNDYVRPSGKKMEDVIGKSLFDAFPARPEDNNFTGKENLSASFQTVISTKQSHQLPVQRYDITNSSGTFEEYYWKATNKPVPDKHGNVLYIIHTAEDITEIIKAEQNQKRLRGIEQAHDLFMQAPVAIHIIKGPEHIIELANRQTLTLWGKQEDVVGKPLDEALPELREHSIKEIVTKVRETGKSYEAYDVDLTLKRNGKDETVYVNFVFQPYFENNKSEADGVLIIALEVTERVLIKQELEEREARLRESDQRFQNLIRETPVGIIVLRGEEMMVDIVNDAYAKLINRSQKDLISKPLFDVIPETERHFRPIVDGVRQSGKPLYLYGEPYHIESDGKQVEGYLNLVYQPYKEPDGTSSGVMVLCQDVTEQVNSRKKTEESEMKLRSIIAAAPAGIGLFVGRDLIVEMPNQTFIDIVGKGPDIESKPLREVMPELVTEGQPFLQILDDVYTSGKMFQSFGSQVNIVQNGIMSYNYYNITYTPVFNSDNNVYAILDIAVDVTDQVLARQKLEQSEQQVRSIVESAPFPIAVYIGKEMRIQLANQSILDVWRKGNDVIGKLYTDILPELSNQEIFHQVDAVYRTGIPFHARNQRVDIMAEGSLQPFYFNYSFTPLFDALGNVYGVMNTAADVTDLIVAKKKVEESERNIRQIILQAPVAMCILREPDYRVEIANERMFELWGKPSVEILNKPIFEGLPEAREQGLEEILLNVYTKGETFKAFEMPINLPRGGTIETTYLNFVYEPLYEANADISGILAVAIDVTQQVLARNKIEESEKEFRELADSLPEMVWTTDNKGAQLFASKRWKEFTGLDPRDAKTFQQIVHPDDLDKINREWSESLSTGKTYKTEVRLKNREGKYNWFYVNGEPVKNSKGEVVKWSGAYTNVHEQKKSEENSRLTSERFRLLADSMPQFVWTGDKDGNLNYFNKAVFDYSGLGASDVEKDGWLQIVHPDERDENVRLWIQAVSTGTDFVFEHRFKRYDGEYRWQLSRAIPQRDIKGKIKMWVGTSTDIQEIKEQADQKDYFIGMVSHELKTPITSITGYIQLLQLKYGRGQDSFLNNALNTVNKQIGKTTKLISELLDVSKIKSGSLSLNKENFIITELVTEVIDEVQHINPGYNIIFDNSKNETLIYADRDRISQVLTNLLINAIKYSPDIKEVKIDCVISSTEVLISITDFGIGIKKQDQGKIFGRFYRVEGKNEKRFPGFGIGLFIASEIIQRHGGKIGVSSEPAKGSVFYFSLPL